MSEQPAVSSASISVQLPDGSKRTLPVGGTGMDLAKAIGPGLAKAVVAARVKTGDTTAVVDLQQALPDGAQVWLLKLDDKDAQEIMRHSAEHILATAVCRLFPGAQVTMGPRVHDKEFYYDFNIGRAFTPEDLEKIEKEMQKLVDEDVPFLRSEVTKDEARALFKQVNQTYKDQILDWIPEGNVSIYKNHDFIDLCRGPHVPSTGKVKAFKLMSVAGAYWRGDATKEMLQRISGLAFPSKDELKKHLEMLEEAKKRDHRKLGKELDLFAFHPLAPASPFFLPKGALVYNKLTEYMRKLYVKYGYQEVVTPQIFDTEMFKISGHYGKYSEGMYFAYGAGRLRTLELAFKGTKLLEQAQKAVNEKKAGSLTEWAQGLSDEELKSFASGNIFTSTEGIDRTELGQLLEDAANVMEGSGAKLPREYGVKPMNCPSHCLLYGMDLHSHRDLPLRIADFGRLHRFEAGGVVHGLARVRTFCQDDAHIFCTPEQIQGEISEFLKLLDEAYRAFEFKDVRIRLATRPAKRVGTEAMWDDAEKALETALKDAGRAYELAPGDGAFYGPKLEFHVKDALDRSWQLGTMQVDYNMPSAQRFDLTYVSKEGSKQQVVMLHRAILGSIERFMGVYLEHVAGKFPMWLAPTQVRILPITERATEFAKTMNQGLLAAGLRAEVDLRNEKLGFKIREAQLAQIPFALVVGDKEVEQGGATVRQRGGKDLGFMAQAAMVDFLVKEAVLP